ncbi:hypothetical protein LguiA_013234 [Lonicera macranthoides]
MMTSYCVMKPITIFDQRFSYMHQHLSQIIEVAKENAPDRVNVKGYFAWSLWDNFEWDKCFNPGVLRSLLPRSLQPQPMDRAVGRSASSFVSDDFSTRSASSSSKGSNAFRRTYAFNLSRRQLESQYEEDEDYEDEDKDYESNIEEDEGSDKYSDPAHGATDNSNESEEEEPKPVVTSYPARCYMQAPTKCTELKK